MGAEANKTLVRRLVDEVWNQGRGDAIEAFFAPDLVEMVVQHHRQLIEAFSDVEVTIDDLIGEGDTVAARLTIAGTHDAGSFAGEPPTGKHVQYGSFRFYRIAENKVVETWAIQDRLGLLQQLGAAPPENTGVEWADRSE